jgi:hypothetical protein
VTPAETAQFGHPSNCKNGCIIYDDAGRVT